MGSMNSIPVISQIKSLVQVIGGDVEGAGKTQNDFINKGIIASQVKSLVHSIQGDNQAARDTQKAFGNDMLQFAENTPVVGHITSGVHAAMGNTKRAQEVALGATKSTLVTLAGAAGALCGPAAVACGATLAVGASAGWDGVDSAVAGEKKGMIKGVHDLATGKATIGDGFDTIVGTGLTAVGGGIAGKMVFKKFGGRGTKVCKRSVDEASLFAMDLPDLNEKVLEALPPTFQEFDLEKALSTPGDLITTIFNIFIILKLVSVGHSRAKPYYDEICSKLYPNEELAFCEEKLFLGLQKFGRLNKGVKLSESEVLFEDSLDSLMFEMNNMVRNTGVGDRLDVSVCAHFANLTEIQTCNSGLHQMLKKLKKEFDIIEDHKIRKKRMACSPTPMTLKFYTKHMITDGVYKSFRNGGSKFHLLKTIQGYKLLLDQAIKDAYNLLDGKIPKKSVATALLNDAENAAIIPKKSAYYLNTKKMTLIPDETFNNMKFPPGQSEFTFTNVELLNLERDVGGIKATAGTGSVTLNLDLVDNSIKHLESATINKPFRTAFFDDAEING